MFNFLHIQSSENKRTGFAGFVCWLLPEPAARGSRDKFLSLAESVRQAVQRRDDSSEDQNHTWKFVCYKSSGRCFIGFVRS